MNRRKLGLTLAVGLTLAAVSVAGCSGEGDVSEREVGTLALPLSTQGPSGAEYRLRDATFQITNQYWYYGYDSDSSAGQGGAAGQSLTVSSEEDPTARSISVDVERGYYYVRLLPGWRLEKVEGDEASDVEATLLSESTQWVYVSPRSTSFVEFGFGLGDRQLWFNGKLNVDLRVWETPEQYYGASGAGAGGAPEWGAAGTGG
jgi:hypothetical protein